MAESSIDTFFSGGLLAESESLVIGFVHDSYVYKCKILKKVETTEMERAKHLPLVSRDARKLS